MNRTGIYVMYCAALFMLAPRLQTEEQIKVGSPAPPLSLRQVLQARREVHGNWEELKGQAVVLEFWATWCGGCVDNIPHINELVEKFKARPIQFISITDETEIEAVKYFLERHPINGWIAFDSNAETFKRYGIEGRPRTVLVSSAGVVRAVTNPQSVTPQVLEDLLADKTLDFPDVPPSAPLLGLESDAPTPLLQVLIRPAAPVEVSHYSPGGVFANNGRYDAYGQTLRQILSNAYNILEDRIEAPEWCGKSRYDFSVVTPQHEEALQWPLIKQTLEAAFGLKLHQEMKDTRVLVLRTVDGMQPKLKVASPEGKSGYWNPLRGEWQAVVSADRLARAAQFVLGEEVFNETGLHGQYEIDLKWNPTQPESIMDAIRTRLGLELVPEQRKMEHLVVDSVKEPKTW